jgi:class 3 adenylate cyclase
MAVYINSKNPNSTELDDLLTNLPTCPGTCIFVDIVNSTGIKYRKGLKDWAKLLNNTFNFISFLNDFPNHIVKGIGDELMLYIPDEDLRNKANIKNHHQLLEEIYATLYNIKHFPASDLFLPCKVALHHCTNVYNITFFENYNDYYGLDVDLTARLMSKAQIHRIVFSEQFFQMAMNSAKQNAKAELCGCLKNVSDKNSSMFKGVPYPTEFRFIDV